MKRSGQKKTVPRTRSADEDASSTAGEVDWVCTDAASALNTMTNGTLTV